MTKKVEVEVVDSLSCNKQLEEIFFLKAAQMHLSVSNIRYTVCVMDRYYFGTDPDPILMSIQI